MVRANLPFHKEIREMVKLIVARFQPARIILFGSCAGNKSGPNSDVDLLVVMPVFGSKREKAVEIGVALHEIRVPKDIIVTTPADFKRRKEIVGTLERAAAREGKTIYAAAASKGK